MKTREQRKGHIIKGKKNVCFIINFSTVIIKHTFFFYTMTYTVYDTNKTDKLSTHYINQARFYSIKPKKTKILYI